MRSAASRTPRPASPRRSNARRQPETSGRSRSRGSSAACWISAPTRRRRTAAGSLTSRPRSSSASGTIAGWGSAGGFAVMAHGGGGRGPGGGARAARCREIAVEGGERVTAAMMTEVSWDVEMLAGDHDAAERAITEGRDELAAMGRPSAMHEKVRALSRLALGRTVDLERLLEITARAAAPVARGNTARAVARARAAAGELDQAEAQARSAVEILAATDFITFHADAELTHGDVLATAGRRTEAQAAYRAALALYEQKGSLVGVGVARERLAGSA